MIGFENLNLKIRKFINFAVKILKDVFGYREGEKFYVLRMERDHKISDNG